MNCFTVISSNTLFNYLKEILPKKSKNNIKSLLSNGCVLVNDKTIKNFDYQLKANDIVKIIKKINNINILYEDNNIIVVDKPYNLLTISDGKDNIHTLYHYVLEYLKAKKQKIFIIHRLDKDTSGIVMFAKNEKVKKLYQDAWNTLAIKRGYIAIVSGKCSSKKTLKSYLKENNNMMVYSSSNGKLAITHYEKIKECDNYSMLQVYIDTGRKNQIRVMLKEDGNPIIGDKKYGSKINPLKRLALHANILEIKDPITKKIYILKSIYSQEFDKLFKGCYKDAF